GAGLYSAYVGAVVDLVRIMSNLHTAKYQYIPAIAFPQDAQLNLRLNTPPSFHNPKSVLVISLPSVQKAIPPPLRTADATHVACLLQPSVVLPIEGAPLVFSAALNSDMNASASRRYFSSDSNVVSLVLLACLWRMIASALRNWQAIESVLFRFSRSSIAVRRAQSLFS
ncbi:MAG: hypothetical protein V4555_15175, partial [Acidobacteriota bacterium]